MQRCLGKGLCILLLVGLAHAQFEFQIADFNMSRGEQAWQLDMRTEIELPAKPLDALNSGLALYFLIDITVKQPRRFWLDRTLYSRQIRYRLSHRRLTSQYLVQNLDSGEEEFFSTLRVALERVGALRQFQTVSIVETRAGDAVLEVSVSLDASQLPAPLRPSALLSNDWLVSSPKVQWTLN